MYCSLPGSSVHEISRQEYWSGLPFPSPGDLPNPGIESGNSWIPGGFLTTAPPGSLHTIQLTYQSVILTTSFSDSIICYNDAQNSGRHLLTFTGLKDMIKDTEEQPDTKVQRVTLCVLALSLCRILLLALMGIQQSWGKSETLLSPLGNWLQTWNKQLSTTVKLGSPIPLQPIFLFSFPGLCLISPSACSPSVRLETGAPVSWPSLYPLMNLKILFI